jgi:tetratricopeptide (TPR) repeat protein
MTTALAVWLAATLAATAANAAPSADTQGGMASMALPGQPNGMRAAPPRSLADWSKGARLFEGLGDFHRPVTTSSAEAQRYFDQGMRFLWAFNHDEATRSFAKAAQIDPSCAACYWGVALTLGPNYNLPAVDDVRGRIGWEALGLARTNAAHASPVEQALIEAVAARYAGARGLGPTTAPAVLKAYAGAMKGVAARFPDDLDLQTLYAEALMNTNPWKLWNADGSPAPGTLEIVAILEGVLAKAPNHPGANHYYVHAVEASPHPERALTSAERLTTLMPAAGHIDHMPAHILHRVGRYEDSAQANRAGAKADMAYFQLTNAPDYYPMYTAHNYQFLAFSAAMEGRRAETIEAMRKARQILPDAMLLGMPGVDWQAGYIYQAMIRFGMWDTILAEPAPDPRLPGLTASWLSAQATALAATGRLEEARRQVDRLEALVAATSPGVFAGNNPARDAYRVSLLRARARVAQASGDFAGAVALLREATDAEDELAYDEPADSFFPSRHLLGALLLHQGDAQGAEAVYRQDLRRNPNNGWALDGLAQALAAQHLEADAEAARQAFGVAWARADVTPPGSAY